ncbi:MAG TPA: peptide ABC transporter permease [Opitutae bacterium]|nr:peptide ABC transporter permease [Opitutae bacterium]
MADVTPSSDPPLGQALGQAVELGESPNRRAWLRFRDNRPAMGASVFLIALVLLAVCWPWVSDLGNQHSDAQFAKPSARHWFGTDVHGRDLFGRVMAGARISLLVGLVGALVSLMIGVLWGATAGLLGGRWDNWMMRTVDVLYSLPSIIFVIVIITTLEGVVQGWVESAFGGDGGETARHLLLYAGLGAVSWLTMARIVRGQTKALRKQTFIDAAIVNGVPTRRILGRHILPNLLGPVIVFTTLTIPAVILLESVISFLGLGVQPPMSSWGILINEGAVKLDIYPWMLIFPAVFFSLTIFALNFVGDGLRDALDPKGSGDS